jgi:phosphotransferase family enzyme
VPGPSFRQAAPNRARLAGGKCLCQVVVLCLTRSVIVEPALVSCLSQYWGLSGVQVTAHNGGMGSETWFADLGDRRWVAKAVTPGDGRSFAGGMAIVRRLDQAGIPAGAPVPARRGQLAVNIGDAWLALLTWVPGRALIGQDDAEQDLIGSTLAKVHRALVGFQVEGTQRFHWVDPAGPGRAGSCTALPCCLSGYG